jgi:ABC-type multidrug transport system fused ATPase/permease subunit
MNENVSLFSGSVKENILLFENQDEANFEQAVHNAHVCLAMDRQIADEGRNISSGEQRRIEIARSLLRSSKVLVFDEVVSTLDIETAYDVERLALDLKEQTIIFVSHNFSGKLIREYDEILVIEDGVLLNHGPYEELVRECDYFRRICEIKFGVSNAS